MPEPIVVPPIVADTVRAALAERDRRGGMAGLTRTAALVALELAGAPVTVPEVVMRVATWHHDNPTATSADGRSTMLAGMWGGRAGRDWASAVLARRPAAVAAAAMTGGMIALYPDSPEELALPGGDPPLELHLTLAYVAEDAAALSDDARQVVAEAASEAAAVRSEPLALAVVGWGTLGAEEPPATVLFLQQPDSAGVGHQDGVSAVAAAVRAVLDDFGSEGFPPEHDAFIPHLTLGYGLPVDVASRFAGRTMTFGAGVTVVLGEERTTFPWIGGRRAARAAAATGPIAAGLAVVAQDTGRVLLIQRALDDEDPASGKWEFPGGHIDEGEGAYEAAQREFCEETGMLVPGALAGGWTSPDGVYQAFIHRVPSEADVPINLDHEDRQVLNPDDPDGDNIEVIAWWDPEDCVDNVCLRDEMATTPWADLVTAAQTAAIADPLPILRNPPRSTRGRQLRRLSRRLATIDRDFRARALAGAQVAMKDALRRAGVKVAVKARNKGGRAAAALAAADGWPTPAVIAAAGMTEQEALDRAFEAYGEQFKTWAANARRSELQAVAAELGLDETELVRQWGGQIENLSAQGAVEAVQNLTSWARDRLAVPTFQYGELGEVPLDASMPMTVLSSAFNLSAGRPLEGPGMEGPGSLADGVVLTVPGRGIVAQIVGDVVQESRPVLTWHWGGATRPFPPHVELDGATGHYETLEEDFPNTGSWPSDTAYYFPGDHVGCTCALEEGFELVETPIAEAMTFETSEEE